MKPPLATIRLEPTALRYFGRLPKAVRDCLKGIFRDLMARQLELEVPTPWRVWYGPGFTRGCQQLIFASEYPEQSTLVILEIRPDTDGDAELL